MATWRILNRQRGVVTRSISRGQTGEKFSPLLPRGVKMEVRVEDTRFKLSFVITIRMSVSC